MNVVFVDMCWRALGMGMMRLSSEARRLARILVPEGCPCHLKLQVPKAGAASVRG